MSQPTNGPAETSPVAGDPLSTKSKILETGASLVQDFSPVKHICAHLNAFHVYAHDTSRSVETNHYCAHLSEDVRQCLLYDSPDAGARLIGIEYMISAKLFEELPSEERKLWHSHVFEVKSGMLIMPRPKGSLTPEVAWEKAETEEMNEVIELYGKVYHLWQTDRGDKVPLGEPQLMTSLVRQDERFESLCDERDQMFGSDWRRKREIRKGIEEPEIHPDADAAWKE